MLIHPLYKKSEIPKWSPTYKQFPPLPTSKLWIPSGVNTPEQIALHKLITQKSISLTEEKQLLESLEFYEKVIPILKSFDLNAKSEIELLEFRNYYLYAFNLSALTFNNVNVYTSYRIVVNRHVLGEEERINSDRLLTFPPLSKVKASKRFNRASTFNNNPVYCAASINAALNELKPKPGDLITIGVWQKKSPDNTLMNYNICHNPLAVEINSESRGGYNAFQNSMLNQPPLLTKFMETIFRFISDQFAKVVKDGEDKSYFYTALFGDQIFSERLNEHTKYQCISYPSVGNEFSTLNLAIDPLVFQKEFTLQKAIELRVDETFYGMKASNLSLESIDLINYKELRSTEKVSPWGHIIW